MAGALRRPSGQHAVLAAAVGALLCARGAPAQSVVASADTTAVASADSAIVPLVTPTARLVSALAVPIDPNLAPAPDGRFFAVLQVRPDPVIWIVPVDGGEPFSFRRSWAASQPRWSPSSNRLGFIAGVGPPRIWTVEVDSASGRAIDPPRLLFRTPANAFAFAPDGSRIAIVTARSTAAGASEIRIVDWESRRSRVLLRARGAIYRLDWSADGYIYYGVLPDLREPDAPHVVRRISIRGGTPETVYRAGEFLGLSPDGAYLLRRAAGQSVDAGRFELARIDGTPVLRLNLPSGSGTPRWAASSRALVQVRAAGTGHGIWEAPVCLDC